MIIGLAHITVATDNLNDLSEYLENGYNIIAEEKNLRNDVQKKKFLSNDLATHDLYILDKAGEPRVELIRYSETKNTSCIKQQQKALTLQTRNLKKDLALLEKLTSSNAQGDTVNINSPIASLRASVTLQAMENTNEDSDNNEHYLNSKGGVCIALIVRNLAAFCEQRVARDIDRTEIFTTEINQKKVNVVLLKTYGGFFIELYEFAK